MGEIISTEPTLEDKIRQISEHYSKDSQVKKLLEEGEIRRIGCVL